MLKVIDLLIFLRHCSERDSGGKGNIFCLWMVGLEKHHLFLCTWSKAHDSMNISIKTSIIKSFCNLRHETLSNFKSLITHEAEAFTTRPATCTVWEQHKQKETWHQVGLKLNTEVLLYKQVSQCSLEAALLCWCPQQSNFWRGWGVVFLPFLFVFLLKAHLHQ